MFYLGNMGHSF